MTAIVEDLLLLARSDSGAVALEHVPVDLGDVAADGASAMGKPADRPRRPGRRRSAAGGRGRRPGPAPPAGHDPGRQRDPPQPDRRPGRGRRPGRDGTGASLVVEDDGPGIRPEDLPHLFERFYRAPGAPGGGTGLGLAIAAVDRRPPRRPDRGRQPGRGRRPLRGRPAGDGRASSRCVGRGGRVRPRGPGSAPSRRSRPRGRRR